MTHPHRPVRRIERFFRPDFPFSVHSLPFYYGWVIMVGATIGTVASIPGHTMGMGVFTDYFINVLGISRLQLAQAYALGTVGSSLCLPTAGVLLDRLGSRPMIVLASLGLAASLLYLASLQGLMGLLGESPGFWLPFAMICLGFFLVRFFGQGALTMISRTMVGRWFNARRSRVTMISSLGVVLAFNTAPAILNSTLQAEGGLATLLWLALLNGFCMALVGYLLIRNTPEQCGLELEGGYKPRKERAAYALHHEFTRGEALRTYSFWAITICFAIYSLTITAFLFHLADIGLEFQRSREFVYAIFPWAGVMGVLATLLTGWAGDRLPMKVLVLQVALGQLMISSGTVFLDVALGRAVLIFGYGLAAGTYLSLVTMIWPRFYGRQNLGAINGASTLFIVFCSAFGPILMSVLEGLLGSYSWAFWWLWMAQGGIVILSFFIENPQRKYEPSFHEF
ncbi:MAG: MFS transporter [Candidatus Sumerlaeia bacterium]|nr:MFS transporter [Candidatus Sumerlaeia bacterium]